MLKAIENGAWNESLRARLSELEARKADLTERMAAAQAPPPALRLTSASADIYRAKVADLEASLNVAEIKTEAAEALRQLIEKVVLTPDAASPDRLAAELHGALAMILQLASEPTPAAGPRKQGSVARATGRGGTGVLGGQLSVVAGPGFEPGTFRL